MARILNEFVIGEPLKSLFSPAFRIEDVEDFFIRVRLEAKAPDANSEGSRCVSINLIELFEKDKPDKFYLEQLRFMLYRMVTHEVDESISYRGQRIFDPHKKEKA